MAVPYGYQLPPANLHPRAVGFVAQRVVKGRLRLALFNADGGLSATFGIGETREQVAEILARQGLVLHDDAAASVTKAEAA